VVSCDPDPEQQGRQTMRRPIEGLILGRSLNASEPLGFNRPKRSANPPGTLITYAGDGHLMTVAPTGTGKTTGPVITNALTHPGQLIVIDIKGEVYAATHRARRKLGRLHVLDLRDDYQGEDSLNPIDLAELGGRDEDVIAQTLATDLVERWDRDPFWTDWATTLLTGGILYSMDRSRDLSSVYNLFHSDDVRLALAKILDEKPDLSRVAYSAFAALINMTDVTFSGVLATTPQQIRLFGSRLAKRNTSRTTIDLAALVAGEPMTLYIIVPPHRLPAYRPMLRVWLSGLIMAFTQRKKMPAHRTLMLCDEIGNLGYLDAFVTAATLLRGWGVTLWTFWQNFAQLDLYGRDARTLVDNAGVIQLFGARNYRAAREFVDLVGGVSAEEIMQLPPNEQILLIEGGNPVRAKSVRYIEDALFTGLHQQATSRK
jgi:type IV secretion system protein VirD4